MGALARLGHLEAADPLQRLLHEPEAAGVRLWRRNIRNGSTELNGMPTKNTLPEVKPHLQV